MSSLYVPLFMSVHISSLFIACAVSVEAAGQLFDQNSASNAVAVLRVQRFYVWPHHSDFKFDRYEVHVYGVIKNESNEILNHDFGIYALRERAGVPAGKCTVYLERYDVFTDSFNKTNGIWVLVGGDATNGVSHVDGKVK
jgi:hypothetical protein